MNTPTHLIIGAAAFARPGAWRITLAALVGAMLPDLSLYLMSGWHLLVLGTPPEIVFGVLYFSTLWQSIFAVDNSFFIWGACLGFALWRGNPAIIALAGAGLLHLLLDFPLHHDDGRMHFWPLTNWIFQSPVSYWDRDHFGGVVATFEILLNLGLLTLLWFRFSPLIPRLIIVTAATFQIAPGLIWIFVFSA